MFRDIHRKLQLNSPNKNILSQGGVLCDNFVFALNYQKRHPMSQFQAEPQKYDGAERCLSSTSETEPRTIDEEFFLKALFTQDPKKGCEVLFRRYYANLCNHALRFVYSKDVAEEVVAEVFANFWQSQAFHHVHSSYQAYLYQAVRYRAYNYLKQEVNRMAPLSAETPHPPTHRPDEVLHYHDLCRKVEGVIQALPPRCRMAFQLNRVEGKKYTEIAAELKISVSGVERLISRALAKLRQELRNDWLLALLMAWHLLA